MQPCWYRATNFQWESFHLQPNEPCSTAACCRGGVNAMQQCLHIHKLDPVGGPSVAGLQGCRAHLNCAIADAMIDTYFATLQHLVPFGMLSAQSLMLKVMAGQVQKGIYLLWGKVIGESSIDCCARWRCVCGVLFHRHCRGCLLG